MRSSRRGTTDVEPGPRGFPVLLGVVMLAVGLLMTGVGPGQRTRQ
jgi:hypothetical protein